MRELLMLLMLAGGEDRPAREPVDSVLSVRISLEQRTLWVILPNGDTVYAARVAVGSGRRFRVDGREWQFDTPIGETTVSAKQVAPLWVPPDWHYHEIAKKHGWEVRQLRQRDVVALSRGRRLLVKKNEVGVEDHLGVFRPLPVDEEIVFAGVLYIPPFGTRNRQVPGVLGPYRLLLANGVGLHGTNVPESIGHAVTHGCIRVGDDDIAWLYENVPLGAPVVIY